MRGLDPRAFALKLNPPPQVVQAHREIQLCRGQRHGSADVKTKPLAESLSARSAIGAVGVLFLRKDVMRRILQILGLLALVLAAISAIARLVAWAAAPKPGHVLDEAVLLPNR